MADNTTLNAGSGGDTVRTIDKTSKKTQVVTLDVGGAGAETLVAGTVPVSGTVTANATLAAETTKVIGTVNIASAQTLAAVTAITNALPAGTNAIGKLAANSGVDIGDTDVTSIIPGVAATNLGKAEDAAHASGDVGVMMLGVRKDTAAALAGTDGDYQPPIFDASGRLHVNVGAGGISGIVNDAAITVGTSEGVLVMGRASAAAPSAVSADNDAVHQWLNRNGATAMFDVASAVGGCTLNSLVAPATPAKNVLTSAASQIYSITAFNLLATPVYLKIWDNVTGSVTLGTTACNYQFMIPGNTAGAGFTVNFPVGVSFATGIITAVTGAISTTDNTSITASSVIVNIASK